MEDWIERDQSQPQPGTNSTEWEMVDAVAVYEAESHALVRLLLRLRPQRVTPVPGQERMAKPRAAGLQAAGREHPVWKSGLCA